MRFYVHKAILLRNCRTILFFDTAFLKNDEIVLKLNKTSKEDREKNWLLTYHLSKEKKHNENISFISD